MEQKNTHGCTPKYGLTIIRLGIGILFLIFGTTKMMGGQQLWESLGNAMKFVGITFTPALWGFCAATVELCGGILLVINRYVRWAALCISCVMIMAIIMHVSTGAPFSIYSFPITMLIIMAGLFVNQK